MEAECIQQTRCVKFDVSIQFPAGFADGQQSNGRLLDLLCELDSIVLSAEERRSQLQNVGARIPDPIDAMPKSHQSISTVECCC